MRVLLVVVGGWVIVGAAVAWVLCRSAALGDRDDRRAAREREAARRRARCAEQQAADRAPLRSSLREVPVAEPVATGAVATRRRRRTARERG
jgi:hypothetical protein